MKDEDIMVYEEPQRYYEDGSPAPRRGKWEACYNQIIGSGETKEEAIANLKKYYVR